MLRAALGFAIAMAERQARMSPRYSWSRMTLVHNFCGQYCAQTARQSAKYLISLNKVSKRYF
jgi:hypothetical protein